MSFDNNSFSENSFSPLSWLMSILSVLGRARRYAQELLSRIFDTPLNRDAAVVYDSERSIELNQLRKESPVLNRVDTITTSRATNIQTTRRQAK